jgi:hypothetical protein
MIWAVALTLHSAMAPHARAADAPAPDFNTDVAPILLRYCAGCHGDSETEGGLRLQSYDDVLAGGRRGPAIAPGRSDQSRMVLLLEGKAKPSMPPEGNEAPTHEEIAVLKAWIDAGALSPSGAPPDRTKLVTPAVPLLSEARRPVNAVAASPDGTRYALAGYGRLRLVEADTFATLLDLEGLRGNVNAVSFSADGALVVAACGEAGLFGEARIYQAADGALKQTIVGHRDSLYAAVLSPDGSILATASYDEHIKLWDATSGAELRDISGHNGAVYDLAFRPDGCVLASASADRTVKLWDVASGDRLDTLGQSLKELYTLAFSPDGSRLAAGGVDNRIRVWQISATAAEGTNPIVYSRFAHQEPVLKLAYSADGTRLASSGEDGTLKLWDAGPMEERSLLEPQSDWTGALCFSRDGQRVLVGRLDGTCTSYDVATGAPQAMPGFAALDGTSGVHVSVGNALRGVPGSAADLGTKRSLVRSIIPGATTDLAVGTDPPPAPPWKGGGLWLLRRLARAALAQGEAPAVPQLTSHTPRGMQRGTTMRVKLTGANLAGASEIKTGHAGIAATLVTEPAATATELLVDLAAAADVPRAFYDVQVVTPGGTSNAVRLWFDDLQQIAEQEPNGTPEQATPLSLPAGAWGALEQAGDEDCYAFEAAAGQRLVLEVAAAAIGSKANAVLTVADDRGRVLASVNDFDGEADPLLEFVVPAAGRYTVRVADLALGASGEHFYRLTAGSLAYVTGVYPLSIPANQAAEVELVGFNLPAGARVALPAAAGAEQAVPVDPALYRARKDLRVALVEGAEALEIEPNDAPDQATPLPATPGSMGGRIAAAGDADLFRFEAQAGEEWIVETEAARRGSPIDTRVEVLDAAGRPIERLLLQAVRDSYNTFRPIDSNQADARLQNWEEMELNQFLYMQGEVLKLFRAPQGPDSGFAFYTLNGRRRCFFDTSATAHALDEPCYIVEPHPPGTSLVPTGLPVFPLHYANDDDGERKLGSDSQLHFTAPAVGTYLVRVADVRGQGGPRHAYRLIVRRPQPGFRVSLGGASPTVPAGSGQDLTLSAERTDGFEGEIRVEIAGLPPGFSVSSPIVIQAGHVAAKATISAAADAPAPTDENASASTARATATIAGVETTQDVNNLGRIALGPAPKIRAFLVPEGPGGETGGSEIVIEPGKSVTAMLRVERNGFDDRISFSVENLPHGVIVDDIGLNGVLVRENETERRIFLRCAPWVPETTRQVHALAQAEGNQCSAPVALHVRRSDTVAGN